MTEREVRIYRAILETLRAVPGGYMLPAPLLANDVRRLVVPPPEGWEFENELRRVCGDACAVTVPGVAGPKYKISDTGKAWLQENP